MAPPDGTPRWVPGPPRRHPDGRHAARRSCARWSWPRGALRYDKGTLATIGRAGRRGRPACARAGLVAWLLWVVIHIWTLIGFRNRLLVMFEWVWLYVTRQRGARVIVELGEEPGETTAP
jgi:NADH dehydrogenase